MCLSRASHPRLPPHRDTMSILQQQPRRHPVWLELTIQIQVRTAAPPAWMPTWATMCLSKAAHLKHPPHRDTMSIPQRRLRRHPAWLEPTTPTRLLRIRLLVWMLISATMYPSKGTPHRHLLHLGTMSTVLELPHRLHVPPVPTIQQVPLPKLRRVWMRTLVTT